MQFRRLEKITQQHYCFSGARKPTIFAKWIWKEWAQCVCVCVSACICVCEYMCVCLCVRQGGCMHICDGLGMNHCLVGWKKKRRSQAESCQSNPTTTTTHPSPQSLPLVPPHLRALLLGRCFLRHPLIPVCRTLAR